MLVKVLGPGRAVARVTADVDFSKFEKEEEAYDPAGQVIRSEKAIEESAGQSAEGGVPGVATNLTNDPRLLTAPGNTGGGTRRAEQVKNYEVSRAVSRTVSAAGRVNKLSVAVLVDGLYIGASGESVPGEQVEAGAEVQKYTPLAAPMLKKIEELVKQTVGFDSTRGDVVTVQNMRFYDAEGPISGILDRAEAEGWIDGVYFWTPRVLLILVFFLLMRPLVRFLVSPSEAETDLSRLLPAGVEDLEAELEAERGKLTAVEKEVKVVPAVDIEELEELLAENSRLVSDNPQQAALLIRYWLNDGRM